MQTISDRSIVAHIAENLIPSSIRDYNPVLVVLGQTLLVPFFASIEEFNLSSDSIQKASVVEFSSDKVEAVATPEAPAARASDSATIAAAAAISGVISKLGVPSCRRDFLVVVWIWLYVFLIGLATRA